MNRIAAAMSACTVAFFALMVPDTALAWGREGHETIAKLAELNLDRSVRRRVEGYLGGHSIVYVAKWMDEVRKTPEFKFTDSWHVATVDENLEYAASRKKGDAIYGIEQAMETLKDYKNLPDSVVALNIRYLVHLIGDMHCPAHVYYATHGAKYNVSIEAAGHNYVQMPLHSMWDFGLIQANRFMCASEWAQELNQVLTKQDRRDMAEGTPREWLSSNARRCEPQFEWAQPDSKLGADFVVKAMPLIETQITYAGIRLASVLNALFK